ncbi:hypothetical protein MKEN_00339900 [Mycena kentingensis (nom. inval.)]|nr:hypothetical protein MKEN_00339900 [Mycena kentingensis (nom. inval.)]
MSEFAPPSLKLPPLRGIANISIEEATRCVEYLRTLYTPKIRGSRMLRRVGNDGIPIPWRYLSPGPQETLSADEFERSYAIRWLTYITHNCDRMQGSAEDLASLAELAASVLANCGGASSAGVVWRDIELGSTSGPIRVKLRDIPLEEGMAGVGAQTWGGACVLSEIIAAEPEKFGLNDSTNPLRVLELGAGTGLVGCVFAKLAHQIGVQTTVVCTDGYPPALENLAVNINANFPSLPEKSLISSVALDWAEVSRLALEEPLPPPLDADFDIILGADIIYEAEHARWIRQVLTRLLKRQSAQNIFHLVIPLRRTHAAESSTVEKEFVDDGDGPVVIAKEIIICDVEEKAGEEVEYAYYHIGWRSRL